MAELKAIETQYKGYRFRSRLEARWAVFFDAMGIDWQYETEGYEIEGHGYYLPDFYLPKSETWVEVKGDWLSVDVDYWRLLEAAIDYGGFLPGVGSSCGTGRGLLLLGNIPEPQANSNHNRFENKVNLHTILQHHKGVWANHVMFVLNNGFLHFDEEAYQEGVCDGPSEDWPITSECTIGDFLWCRRHVVYSGLGLYSASSASNRAYQAARSARFEHGETP
jgi:hypothetical protein